MASAVIPGRGTEEAVAERSVGWDRQALALQNFDTSFPREVSVGPVRTQLMETAVCADAPL